MQSFSLTFWQNFIFSMACRKKSTQSVTFAQCNRLVLLKQKIIYLLKVCESIFNVNVGNTINSNNMNFEGIMFKAYEKNYTNFCNT